MSDILWQNANTSQVGVWEMNGTSIMAAVAPTTPGAGWQLKNDGPISPDQMGTADSGSGGTMRLSAPDTANGAAPGLRSGIAPPLAGFSGSLLASLADPAKSNQVLIGS
jgi:hypothetical protein